MRTPAVVRVLGVAACVAAVAACDRSHAARDREPAKEVAAAVDRSREEHPDAWRRKVVLLGFDACDPDLLKDMIQRGKLPNFARLRREGATGRLESITPLLSPIVWTTIATGVTPERHGILDFVVKIPTQEEPVPVTSRLRTADTMWEILSDMGEQVGVVGWLVTAPADPLNGFVVTERMGGLAFEYGKEQSRDVPGRTYPEELAEEVERVDLVTVDDLPLWKVRPFADVDEDEYAAAYSQKFHPQNRLGNLRLTLATGETFRAAGQRLLRERRPRFFACYFEAMDALCHLFMPYAPPKLRGIPEDEYLRFRSAIEANYVWHDQVLGEFMDLCDPDTTLILVSDHGFKSGEFRREDSSDFHAKSGAQWHRLYGVIQLWGNGVKKGHQVNGATVYDVAPTVLAAMGYPVPKDWRGKVLRDAFSATLPAAQVPTYFGDQRKEEMATRNAEEDLGELAGDEEARERLRTLGYIGGPTGETSSTQMHLGGRFLEAGRVDEAVDVFKKALEAARTPQSRMMAHNSLGEAYLRQRKLEDAERQVKEALAVDPTDVQGRLLQARVAAAAGDLERAEAIARGVRVERPDLVQSHTTLAYILRDRMEAAEKAGDHPTAQRFRLEVIQAYEAALRLEPLQAAVLHQLAQLRLASAVDFESVEKAREELDRTLELKPRHYMALNNRAIALLRLGILADHEGRAADRDRRFAEALDSTQRADEVVTTAGGAGYPKARANRAYVLWKSKRLPEALEAALSARELDPSYKFNPVFVEELRAAGHELPPPAPRPPSEAGSPKEPQETR